MMAGTRPCRRVRRAGPLPNSVRGSAAMRTSGTVVTPLVRKIWRRREMLARGPRAGPGQAAALQTKTRTQARWAESLAGCGHTRVCPPGPPRDRGRRRARGYVRARRSQRAELTLELRAGRGLGLGVICDHGRLLRRILLGRWGARLLL